MSTIDYNTGTPELVHKAMDIILSATMSPTAGGVKTEDALKAVGLDPQLANAICNVAVMLGAPKRISAMKEDPGLAIVFGMKLAATMLIDKTE